MKNSSLDALITIRANGVTDNRNGTFTIALPGVALEREETQMIERLFPNLGEAAFRLLNQEALLAAMATPSEVMAPPKKEKY